MTNASQYRTTIYPVKDHIDRPLWSVMIPTYNCANYLRDTLRSVLQQDPGPEMMQIEVVDDHSTQDDPEAVVRELGGGRVAFFQQAENVGHTRNFDTCLQRSRGYLVHQLHGDDCVRDGFYAKMQHAFEEHPEIGAGFCRHIFMDRDGHWSTIRLLEQPESGILPNWLEKIAIYQRIQTPSMVVRREVYEKLGAFDRRLSWTEDWEMWTRIAAHFPIWYEVEPLALYRTSAGPMQHNTSSTARHELTGANIRDARRAIQIIAEHLPDDIRSQVAKQSLRHWARFALRSADKMRMAGNTSAMVAQIREAFACDWSLAFTRRAIRFYLDTLKLGMRQVLQKSRYSKQ